LDFGLTQIFDNNLIVKNILTEIFDKRFITFIKKHHVLTMATCINNIPYCANCFYAFDKEYNRLIFTSSENTRHIEEGLQNSQVAGSIVLETNIVGKIKGLQFQGRITKPDGERLSSAEKLYYKRFPYAKLMDSVLWEVELSFAKLTDNTLGFGTKLIWNSVSK